MFKKCLQNVYVTWMVQWITVVMMVEFVHALPMSLEINVMFVQLVGMVSQLAKVRYIIKCLELFLFKKYLQNVYVMWMVQWITAVLMMVVFVHVLPMSLVINVMFVQLGGMDSQPVKVRYVIRYMFELFLLPLKLIFRMSM